MTCEICGVPLEKPEERRTVRTRMEPDAPAREVVCCPGCAERVKARKSFAEEMKLIVDEFFEMADSKDVEDLVRRATYGSASISNRLQ